VPKSLHFTKLDLLPDLMNNIARTTAYLNELLEIKRAINEIPKKFLEVPPWLKFMLTHGIQPPGQRDKNSISNLVEAIFGASIDPEEYYVYARQNLPPSMEINIISSGIPVRLEVLYGLLKVALNISEKLGIKPPFPKVSPTADEVFSEPDKLPELFEKFLNSCSNLSVGVNDLMTFVFGIRKLTKRYIKHAYPELANRKTLNEVTEILGLEKLFEPDIADKEKRDEYTIIGYPDYVFDIAINVRHMYGGVVEFYVAGIAEPKLCNSFDSDNFYSRCERCPVFSKFIEKHYSCQGYFCVKQAQTLGGTLCKINDMIWSIFKLTSEELGIPDIGKMYMEESKKELMDKGLSIPSWAKPKKVPKWSDMYPCSISDEFRIKEGIVTIHSLDFYRRKKGLLGILEFLENIMPLIYLGFCELIIKKEEHRAYDHVAYLVWRWAI